MEKALSKPPCKRLTKKQLGQLASFTDPGTVLTTLAKEGWTIEESIKHLVAIAKGSRELEVTREDGSTVEREVKTSVQLNAIKYLNQLVVDAMERSGLMVMAKKKFIGEDGQEVQFTGHVVSSMLGEQKETTKEDLTESMIPNKEDTNGRTRSTEEASDSVERRKEETTRESELRSTKAPSGEQAAAGHFGGVAKQGGDEITGQGSGDYL